MSYYAKSARFSLRVCVRLVVGLVEVRPLDVVLGGVALELSQQQDVPRNALDL